MTLPMFLTMSAAVTTGGLAILGLLSYIGIGSADDPTNFWIGEAVLIALCILFVCWAIYLKPE